MNLQEPQLTAAFGIAGLESRQQVPCPATTEQRDGFQDRMRRFDPPQAERAPCLPEEGQRFSRATSQKGSHMKTEPLFQSICLTLLTLPLTKTPTDTSTHCLSHFPVLQRVQMTTLCPRTAVHCE